MGFEGWRREGGFWDISVPQRRSLDLVPTLHLMLAKQAWGWGGGGSCIGKPLDFLLPEGFCSGLCAQRQQERGRELAAPDLMALNGTGINEVIASVGIVGNHYRGPCREGHQASCCMQCACLAMSVAGIRCSKSAQHWAVLGLVPKGPANLGGTVWLFNKGVQEGDKVGLERMRRGPKPPRTAHRALAEHEAKQQSAPQ